MPQNFRKWAIGIVAFFLCFSFAVNVHCVILLFRYRQIYQAPPVWATEAGEYVAASQVVSSSAEVAPLISDATSEVSGDESVKADTHTETTDETKPAEATERKGTTVYLTKSGTKFHRDGCSSLSKSKIPISYEDAVARGFEPCGRCNP